MIRVKNRFIPGAHPVDYIMPTKTLSDAQKVAMLSTTAAKLLGIKVQRASGGRQDEAQIAADPPAAGFRFRSWSSG